MSQTPPHVLRDFAEPAEHVTVRLPADCTKTRRREERNVATLDGAMKP